MPDDVGTFWRVLPLLEGVPGFSGIRIHSGNVIDDTEGCILVGRRTRGPRIAESQIALRKLMATLERADAGGDGLVIEIRNPNGLNVAGRYELPDVDAE